MIACVLDASVVARWFVGDPQASQVRAARGMRSELRAGQIECHAPRLLFVEVANAIWKECRFGSLPPLDARALIQDLSVLDVVAHDHEPLLRSEEHTSELQSRFDLVCRLLLEKK